LVQTRLKTKGLSKEKCFEFRVRLMRGEASRGVESVAMPSDGGDEGCRSCLSREFQSTGAWWIKTKQLLYDVSELKDVAK